MHSLGIDQSYNYDFISKRISVDEKGNLYWKTDRPKEDYKTEHGYKCFIARCSGKSAETIHTYKGSNYKVVSLMDKQYLGHRLVWLLYYGHWPENQIDHIDGDGLNNNISNLREVDTSGNARNRKRISTNTSGASGVFYEKSKEKWRVRFVCSDGVRRSFGSFVSKDEALKVRDLEMAKHGYTETHGKR